MVSHANEKGWYGVLFNMWIVRNGIANLLSVPQLEHEGFVLTYDTRTTWHIHCPDGKAIALDRELGGVCDRFFYIDMSQLLNQSAVSLVNTVRKNYECFTRREVEKAILYCKAHERVGNRDYCPKQGPIDIQDCRSQQVQQTRQSTGVTLVVNHVWMCLHCCRLMRHPIFRPLLA